MKATAQTTSRVNGLDLEALRNVVEEVGKDPSKGMVQFRVRTEWKGQARSETSVESYTLGGQRIARAFKIPIDEPVELLGSNTAPNPQETLMAAFNACVMVGYAVGAAVKGITLEKLEIETDGEIDLRGFLGIDQTVRPGYEKLRYVVRMKGNGTTQQFREVHENVIKTSPNYFNISKPLAIDAILEAESLG
jgi:uncharacterized OsmC-like protein